MGHRGARKFQQRIGNSGCEGHYLSLCKNRVHISSAHRRNSFQVDRILARAFIGGGAASVLEASGEKQCSIRHYSFV